MLCVILILDDGKNFNYESERDGTCQAGISGATSSDGFTQVFLMGMSGRYLVNGILLFHAKDNRDNSIKAAVFKPGFYYLYIVEQQL